MYLAAVVCNVGSVHWADPARWMYHHLLDGDLASNALSWQWVAGCTSGKKYYANQENINRYCRSSQRGTFMDHDYPELTRQPIPQVLEPCAMPPLLTPLPVGNDIRLDSGKPLYVFNYYNIDPHWAPADAQRVLLLEPSVFARHPVSAACVEFALALARQIPGMQVCVGEFRDLQERAGEIHYREHPLNAAYSGTEHSRPWMFEKHGKLNSFFSYWKPIERQLLK
jgi:deoxyribodipyrimidine photo-lyase